MTCQDPDHSQCLCLPPPGHSKPQGRGPWLQWDVRKSHRHVSDSSSQSVCNLRQAGLSLWTCFFICKMGV